MPLFSGYSTGVVIKQQKDRREYIDDFYAAHPEAPRPMARYASCDDTGNGSRRPSARVSVTSAQAKRAHSLPDVLNDDDDCCEGENGRGLRTNGRAADVSPRRGKTGGSSTAGET